MSYEVISSVPSNVDLYVDKRDQHSFFTWHTVAIIIIVILLIILILWFVSNFTNLYTPQNFGQWGPPVSGPCETANNLCTETGTQTTIRQCIPNEATGRGCLTADGQQTFQAQVTKQSCKPRCIRSDWDEDISACETSVPAEQCVPLGTIGQQTITETCRPRDNSGSNLCVKTVFTEYTDSQGVEAIIPQTVQYEIGETVVTEVSCENYVNPICGQWLETVPVIVGRSNITQFDTITNCNFNTGLTPVATCNVGADNVFTVLQEGFSTQPLACISDDIVVTPVQGAASLNSCQPLQEPNCSAFPVSATDIINQTLPNNYTGLSCSGSNNSNNPQCINACRKFPGVAHLGTGEMDSILNAIMIVQIPTQGYVAPYQYPSDDGQLVLFRNTNTGPNNTLGNVPLILVPFNTNVSEQCSSNEVQFSSSLLLVLGVRAYSNNTLHGPILTYIGDTYAGWLDVAADNLLYWQQAYNQYGGPGEISSNAAIFTIERTGNLNTDKIAGMPASVRGKLPVTISYNGNDVYITRINGERVNLHSSELVLFPPDVNLSTRSSGVCNLYRN